MTTVTCRQACFMITSHVRGLNIYTYNLQGIIYIWIKTHFDFYEETLQGKPFLLFLAPTLPVIKLAFCGLC